jgi:hypothetical protein
MTSISGVDTSSAGWQDPAMRVPRNDFSHELAKGTEERTHSSSDQRAQISTDQRDSVDVASTRDLTIPAFIPQDSSNKEDSFAPNATGFAWSALQEQLNAIVQPTGVTEALLGSRVFGVHLLASTYLSELSASSDPASNWNAEQAAPKWLETSAETGTGLAKEPTGNLSNEVEYQLPTEIGTAVDVSTDESGNAELTNLRHANTTSAAAVETLWEIWPESSMRLTKQRDGSTVVWLRDYRTSSEDASQLVASLITDANAKGIRLGKIVLNGREVWSPHKNTDRG